MESQFKTLKSAPDILAKIAAYKLEEVKRLKDEISICGLKYQAKRKDPPKGFLNALIDAAQYGPAIIAEVKKASPSKGIIREDFDPAKITQQYENGGAACLSILTDGPGFQGSKEIFSQVREATGLPLLRKDFMLDPIQITESRAMGADAILIILSMIDDNTASDLMTEAHALGMDCLVETHDLSEVRRAIGLGANLIGINNRNLRTFETSLKTFEKLAPHIPERVTLIAESGVFTTDHIARLTEFGANGFLIGESLMRQHDVEKATRKLTGKLN